MAAQFIVRGCSQRGLHALEVGQAVGEVPGLHAGVGSPALVVQGVAALEDHAVDGLEPPSTLPRAWAILRPCMRGSGSDSYCQS